MTPILREPALLAIGSGAGAWRQGYETGLWQNCETEPHGPGKVDMYQITLLFRLSKNTEAPKNTFEPKSPGAYNWPPFFYPPGSCLHAQACSRPQHPPRRP